MPHSSDQLDQLATLRRPIPMGFYHNRRRISVIPRETLEDGDDVAFQMGTTDGGGFPIYNINARWYRGGGRPDIANSVLGDKLSRAVCPDDTYATREHGPIRTVLDRAGRHRFGLASSAEWCAMMNVKVWRIHGTVGPFTFDETVGAGQIVRYTPDWDPPAEDWVYEMTHRAAYGMGFTWTDTNEDGVVSVVVRLGTTGSSPLQVLDELNESPSGWQLVPTLVVDILDTTPEVTNQSASTAGGFAGNRGAGVEDPNITFLGQPLRMITTPGDDDLTGHSLAIDASAWWGPEDPWVGE